MSVRVSTWAWKQEVGGNRKLVLLAIADQANDSGIAWPGHATLAERCGISLRALQTHLASLESDGYLTRERRHRSDGARTSDRYTLHLPADFAGGTGDHPQNLRRLPAVSDRTKRQNLRPLKGEPSEEPSGEPGPLPRFAHFDKAVKPG